MYQNSVGHEVDSAKFWDSLYVSGGDGWELGGPAPVLARILEESPPATGRIAVPGCGRGHDVALLASRGYDATGFDFSDEAVAEASRRGTTVLKRDVFGLGEEFPGAFDAVWEYTCFCAIAPARREEYVEVLAEILRRGGELIALFYPLRDPKGAKEGPPFPVRRAEVEKMLTKHFRVVSMAVPADSIERRKGHELLVRAIRA